MGINLLDFPPDTRTRWERWKPNVIIAAGVGPYLTASFYGSYANYTGAPNMPKWLVLGVALWTLICVGWLFKRKDR